jgi:ribosome biogenesis protein Tsr3
LPNPAAVGGGFGNPPRADYRFRLSKLISFAKRLSMTSEREKAKKMFFDYACHTFFMQNDGVLEEYKKFGISESQETEWRREYISFWA